MTTDERAAAAAKAGDEAAFSGFVERHRRELQIHAYRMTGNFEEAEDLVQETFLRAWRRRGTYAGRSTFRAWLYAIATNACLDAIAAKPERGSITSSDEILWLQPYPNALLEPTAPRDDEPDAIAVARETIEIAFLVAMQHLPPRQRAVLIVRDVLGWSAAETATLLDLSVPAANSALQRARETLKQRLPERRVDWAADPTAAERAVVKRYVDAHERADMAAVAGLLARDAKFWMPPEPGVIVGDEQMLEDLWGHAFAMGDWRLIPTAANRMPATACYLKRAGDDTFRAMAMDVLRIEGDRVAEITTFDGRFFGRFGLPPEV